MGEDTVAITETSSRGGMLAFRFVSGNSTELPVMYDPNTATTASVNPGGNRFVVNGAWVIVYPAERIVLLERKRPGVPVYQIEKFLSNFGRGRLGMAGLTMSLNPIPSRSFEEEVSRFTRIREASITLKRPNHSWTKSAEAMLGELGESNAGAVQLQLNADRGQSLSKTRGVVNEVIELARRPINALKNAVIKGRTPEYEGERSVSLQKHVVKGTARIDPHSDAIDQLAPLLEVASQMVEEIGDLEWRND
ncbi:hypothetical protein [Zhihengliuella salsuginis]|uniref:Uncharacterized protein n=1 Tax=Zhihengliuella salsuginis TaxID=578222 RepID=A0ABQ3GIQ5_9MICC|nr:hypothetical protein [Zhihengliuella salsuginis]GHD06215.1 hypothetical protein GCM10008096_15930 [Zhihengliuella salsuginis]